MEYLGVADRIVGVCDSKYILIKDIQRRLALASGAKGKIEDCGNSMSPDMAESTSAHDEHLALEQSLLSLLAKSIEDEVSVVTSLLF